MKINSLIKVYCKELKILLVCPPKDAKRCINDVRKIAERLQTEQPEISMDKILKLLGEPQDVAQMFLETLDPVRLERYRRRKKLVLRVLFCASILFLALSFNVLFDCMVNPQSYCTVEVYISEPEELSPDDPRAVDPYADCSTIEYMHYMFNEASIRFRLFFGIIMDDVRKKVWVLFN